MRRMLFAATAFMLVAGLLVGVGERAAEASCGNPVQCENALQGTPETVWDAPGSASSTIQGFADPFSVNLGQTINFKIKSPATSYKIDIYRIGYYNGDGARLEASATPNISVSQSQPTCSTNTSTGLVDCGNWSVSASWTVPSTMVSGVYFAKIYRTDSSTDSNQIPFVVRNDASHSDVVYMTSDETWQAYNDWGGYSVYAGTATGKPWCCSALDPGRAVQVSYNRPFATRYDTPGGQDFFFSTEYPMIQFMEENGYDVSYVSQIDVGGSNGASLLEQHKLFVNTGHSEYWDAGDRANLTAARDAGVNVAFFAGNLMWWKTRFAPSQFGNEANRTMIVYKESLDSTVSDPSDPPTWTGEWRDPRFSPPGDGGNPENGLTGQLWKVNQGTYALSIPAAYSKLRLWRNTSVAGLAAGQTATMPNETLGYEWDLDVDNGSRPAGEVDLSQTCETGVPQMLEDYPEDIGSGNACNSLTMYRAASGALVFDTGSVQWAWGLDADHDGGAGEDASTAMQQATVNLFADMGAQPSTLMSGLVAAAASSDHTAPASTISSPAANATIANGSTVTVSGTATDSGGGVVAGVEVSTDSGKTWHPVTTMSPAATSVTWSYTWNATGLGSVSVKSRATDDSGNTETPGSGVAVTVNCPCTLYSQNYVPSVTSQADDSAPYELGVKFTSSINGWVTGIRFYKGSGNTGTHTGSLWSSTGTQLATGTFTNETASGWQTMLFSNPVQITANTVYVASYFDPNGRYATDSEQFYPGAFGSPSLSPLYSPPLSAVRAGASASNGVYNAGGPGFPTTTFDGSGYGVDVVFSTTNNTPPQVTAETPANGSTGNLISVTPTATFSQAVTPSSVSFTVKDSGGNSVAGTVTFNAGNTVATFTPSSSLTASTSYTATVSGAQNASGTTMTSPFSWSFTTGAPVQCPCSIWNKATPTGAVDSTDTNSVNLGVQFQATNNGFVSAVRFYKEADNTGTHVGSLWTSTGTLLATGTFTGESASGWQELDFANPVAITAGTTYVASYHTNVGHYAATSGGLAAPVTNGPLTALAGGGVFGYGSGNAIPTSSFNNSNYWVDVVYSPSSANSPPVVIASTPANASTGNPVSVAPTATFSVAVTPSTTSFTLKDSGGNPVTGTVSFNGTNTVATFTPASSLASGATYTATVSGAQNASGVAMTNPYTWTFTTAPSAQCPCSIWQNATPSGAVDAADTNAVNLGVQFQANTSGNVTGVRFYKEADNTGTHSGALWTSTGTLLATGTFTGESASGWQELDFANPVAITAGTTYVASYFTGTGHYAATTSGLASAVTNGPLTALAGGGVFAYGSANTFPSSSYNNSNYWVDVVYSPSSGSTPPVVTTTSPANGSTGNPVSVAPTATFSQAVTPSTVTFTLKDSGGTSVTGTVSFNSTDTVATFTPASSLASGATYTATVSGAQNASGTPMTGSVTWNFTTNPAPQCPCSIWQNAAPSGAVDAADNNGVNLGIQFQANISGKITGVRFYKEADNTGTHVGSLWTSTGTLLATGTFTSESASGWQELDFSSPVAITAGTTYVASYYTSTGHYAATTSGLTSAVANGPLTALAGGGVFAYGSGNAFPSSSYNNSNYWVDVVFSP